MLTETRAAAPRTVLPLRAPVSNMVYGFGGDPSPDPETLDVLEDVMVEFVSDVMQRAGASASKQGKVRTQDLLYVIRKSPKQWGRAKELLLLKKEIEEAKRTSQTNDTATDAFEAYTVNDPQESGGLPAEEDVLNSGDEP